jgi:hypothetical protein
MANKKINDLAAAGAVGDTMQFETDIGGTTANKVTALQIKNYTVTGGDHSALTNLTFDTAGHGTGKTGFQRGTTSSASNPTVNDDDTQGYREGDFWINTTSDIAFVCVDPATGAAIWHIIEHSASDIWNRTGTTIEPTNAGDDVDMGTGDVTSTDITATNEVITDTISERTATNGIDISFSAGTGKFYDYSAQWFSMSGSGTPDDGTNFYIPYTSSDDWYVGYGMSATDLIYMGGGTSDFILTGDGQLQINALKFGAAGQQVNTISTDTNLGTSDTVLSTQNAIKTYVDNHTANGVWERIGTTISPKNTGDDVDLEGGTFYGNNTVSGNLILDSTSNATKGDIQIADGTTLASLTTNYETLVVADNDIPNKKYVDDHPGSGIPNQEILTISTPGQTAFTLAQTAVEPEKSMLVLNGQVRIYGGGNDYTISGTALTWNDPGGLTLVTADVLQIWYWYR